MAKKRLGDVLLDSGEIGQGQLTTALNYQQRWGVKLGRALIDLGFVKEKKLYETLSESLKIPIIDVSRLRPESITAKILGCIPEKVAKKNRIVPLLIQKLQSKDRLVVATSDPLNYEALKEVRFTSPLPLYVMIAPDTDIDWFINRYYERRRVAKNYVSVVQMKRIGQDEHNIQVVESIFEDSMFDSNTKVYRPKKD